MNSHEDEPDLGASSKDSRPLALARNASAVPSWHRSEVALESDVGAPVSIKCVAAKHVVTKFHHFVHVRWVSRKTTRPRRHNL